MLLRLGAADEDPRPRRDGRLPEPLRLELDAGERHRWSADPRVVAGRRPAPQLQVPGGHGTRGPGAAKGRPVGGGRGEHGGEPREGGEPGGDRAQGAQPDARRGAAGAHGEDA